MANRFESFSPDSAPAQENPDIETEIAELLDELPEELAERWEDAHRSLDLAERKTALAEFLDKRSRVLHDTSDVEAIRIIHEIPPSFEEVMRQISRDAHEIGKGENGRVVVDERGNPLAYKFLTRTPLKNQNTLIEEAHMQAGIHSIAVQYPELRIGVPAVEYFLSTGTMDVIAMELLDAVSIEDILTSRAEFPEGIELEEAFACIEAFLAAMHDGGYYHMDLRPGNILLPRYPRKDGPLAYIIDMGQAVSVQDVSRGYSVGTDGTISYDIDKDPDYVTMRKAKAALLSHLPR